MIYHSFSNPIAKEVLNVFNISVIIPLYNAEPFIAKAIESCLQFPEVKEILVIDDGYEDNAREVVKCYAKRDLRIKLLQHPNRENKGASASRNLGIKKATQEYIAFLDADDFYLSNRFNRDKEVLSIHPDADGCYSALGVHFYSKKEKTEFEKYFGKNKLTSVSIEANPTKNNLFKGLSGLIRNFGYFSLDCLTIKKSSLLKYNLFFNDNLYMHEDTEFLIKLAFYCKLYPSELKIPTAKRGVHESNRITANHSNERISRFNNRFLQFDSLYNWGKEQNINSNVLLHFKQNREFYRLAKAQNPKLYCLLKEIYKSPSLLKNRKFISLFDTYTQASGYLPRIFFYYIPKFIHKVLKTIHLI